MASTSKALSKLAFPLFISLLVWGSTAQLSTDFYSKSCPHVFPIVRYIVESTAAKEARMVASVLRLFFHDCFVNGCDASLLLDDTATFTREKMATPNRNSARGFNVVDNIKSDVEKVCPGVVSCADILAIAARDAVVVLGGPDWDVKLGRRDTRTASQAAANNSLPPPTSSLRNLTASFQAQGLSIKEMVVLSDAHTIGQSRCTNIKSHIYNETGVDSSFAKMAKANCPRASGPADNNTAPLDVQTPTAFDNHYYQNLINKKGILHSDQQLFSSGPTDPHVKTYSGDPITFYADFVAAMIKMGDIKPLIGSNGEIRKNCRKMN